LLAVRLTDASETDASAARQVLTVTLTAATADADPAADAPAGYYNDQSCALVARLEADDPPLPGQIRSDAFSTRMINVLNAIGRHTAVLATRPDRRTEASYLPGLPPSRDHPSRETGSPGLRPSTQAGRAIVIFDGLDELDTVGEPTSPAGLSNSAPNTHWLRCWSHGGWWVTTRPAWMTASSPATGSVASGMARLPSTRSVVPSACRPRVGGDRRRPRLRTARRHQVRAD
jgi:hypothetical protein